MADEKLYQVARDPGRNRPMYVAQLAQWIKEAALAHNADPEADAALAANVSELRRLAVSAVLQLEQLKEELHRLAPTTQDVRTQRMLVNATELINMMRHG